MRSPEANISEFSKEHLQINENQPVQGDLLSPKEINRRTQEEFDVLLNQGVYWQTNAITLLYSSNPEEAIAHIPSSIDFYNLDIRSVEFFLVLFERRPDLFDQVFIKELDPIKIDNSLDAFFTGLLIRGGAELVMKRLPNKLDYSNQGMMMPTIMKYVTAYLTKKNIDDHFFPTQVDLNNLSFGGGETLATYLKTKKASELISLLPEKADLTRLSIGGERLILALTDYDPTIVLNYLPQSVDLNLVSDTTGRTFVRLISDGFAEAVYNCLPKKIKISQITSGSHVFIARLYNSGFKKEILDKISKEKLDLNTLSEPASKFVTSLSYFSNKPRMVKKMIPRKIDLLAIEPHVTDMLCDVYRDNLRGLVKKLPRSVRFAELSEGGAFLLKRLIIKGFQKKIVKMIKPGGTLTNFNKYHNSLLSVMNRDGIDTSQYESSVSNIRTQLRKPLDIQHIELQGKVGPYLFDQVQKLPIIESSIKKMKNGWYKARLSKGHSDTYVFINLEGETPKIVFRNDKVSPDSIKALQKASQLMPGFVSSPYYQELALDKDQDDIEHVLRYQGFREVYAGPSMSTFSETETPPEIWQSIENQKEYIHHVLETNGIYHGHPHQGNTNVRFLLEDSEGNKSLSFDLNHAIQVAQAKNMTLTPIVIMRDWDIATIKNKKSS